MSEFLFVVHPDRTRGDDIAAGAVRHLAALGHRVVTPASSPFALEIDGEQPDRVGPNEVASVDFVVALGGDGTMLYAVHVLDGAATPILGVNLGNLGYLTEIEPSAMVASLDRMIAGPESGGWTIDERMMLDIEVERPDGTSETLLRALNEVVVEKREPGHTISLSVRIDGEPFTTYAADAMIVATPTGSTAYSLSARGPIVSPKHRALLITPVAPHMLFDRTMVLDPTERVSLDLIGTRSAVVAVDGRTQADIQPGTAVRCRPSERTARFIRFGNTPYHQVLKKKFGLADRS